MSASVNICDKLSDRPVTRALHIDDTWRFTGAMWKRHGRSRTNFQNSSLNLLGVNFVLTGTGTYSDSGGISYALKPGTMFHRYPERLIARGSIRRAINEFFVPGCRDGDAPGKTEFDLRHADYSRGTDAGAGGRF